MKHFLTHLAAFAVLIILLLSAIRLWNKWRINALLRFPTMQVAALGDSHMMCALNPFLFPGSINHAQTAEPLSITYRKLQLIGNQNPQLEKVLLGISFNTLSDYNDRKLVQNPWAGNQLKRIAGFTTLHELRPAPLDTALYWRHRLKRRWLIPLLQQAPFTGEFKSKPVRLAEADLQKTIERQFYTNEVRTGLSQIALPYLDSIINWGDRNGRKIILVALPVHPDYQQAVPVFFKNKMDSIKQHHAKHWLELSGHYYDDHSLFHDYDHLSKEGAQKFTLELKSKLDGILLE